MKLVKNAKNGILGLATAIFLSGCATSKPFTSVAASAYHDTRGMHTATLVGNISNLPLNTNLFGFIDIETEKENKDNLKKPYTEIRLSKKAENGLGIAIEYDRDFFLPKGTTRLGMLYEPDLSKLSKDLFLGFVFFLASTNNQGMQSVVYGEKTFNKRDFYISGYLDYNLEPRKIVTDIQFGKRIKDNLYFVVEGRYNGFRKHEEKGIGIGLEWKF